MVVGVIFVCCAVVRDLFICRRQSEEQLPLHLAYTSCADGPWLWRKICIYRESIFYGEVVFVLKYVVCLASGFDSGTTQLLNEH
ncbi:unnamed protein product [Toxocara canis]|uniref:Secreted protein n=1 Tax=Toxocara canis TaxID=6265 RepID=A0A183UWC3_TOXCA|nr:unnamed protein product [Toxocara canis]